MTKAILYDASKCTACRACQVACKQWWELPGVTTTNKGTYENPPDLGAETWNKIRFNEVVKGETLNWIFTRQACMHCTEAACVWVCPTYARKYNELGYVSIDAERCIGCARCVVACPFGVPRIGKDDITPRISVQSSSPRYISYKCAFCKDRTEDGITPACVKTCQPGALQFGERTDLLDSAQARVEKIKATYPEAHLYGTTELGGLHVLYVLTDSTNLHGLPVNPQFGTYNQFDEKSFPDWYMKAIDNGELEAFPSGAKREWYLQSPLTPASQTKQEDNTRTGIIGLWGSFITLGVIGAGAALWWTISRRMQMGKTRKDS